MIFVTKSDLVRLTYANNKLGGSILMEMDKKKAVIRPVIQAAIIMAVFYVTEIIWVYLDVFPDNNTLYIADIILRVICGTAGLIILSRYSRRGESKFTLKQLFTNKIPPRTWLVLLPIIIDILLPFAKIFTAYIFTTEYIVTLTILIIQQFATGFFEEGVQRGLMMNGLIRLNTATVKQRMFTVIVAGAFFGLGHLPNLFFGENPLVQVPATMLWGMFIAAVYMLSDNLLLVMLLHALSDSTFRIVNAMFGYARDSWLCHAVDTAGDILLYVILPVTAILICIFYDRLKKINASAGN